MLIVQEVKCPVICNSNRIIGLLLKRWGVLYFPVYFDRILSLGGWWGLLNKISYGRLRPFNSVYHFWWKRYPFLAPFIHKWYPFHIPSLEQCIPLTALWITHHAPSFLKIRLNHSSRKFFFLFLSQSAIMLLLALLGLWQTAVSDLPTLWYTSTNEIPTLWKLEAWKRHPFWVEPPLYWPWGVYSGGYFLHRSGVGYDLKELLSLITCIQVWVDIVTSLSVIWKQY